MKTDEDKTHPLVTEDAPCVLTP